MTPQLNEGEIYVGGIISPNRTVTHTILLPGDNDDADWQTQMEWAKSIGGDLPTRIEQAMLWANHRNQFQRDWYWSNETRHAESGWACGQDFGYGLQYENHKDSKLRARAVRRVEVKQ